MIQKICVYPGTFDPIHLGHLDIIKRALNIFETVIVAVASNPNKNPLFSLEERIDMIKKSTEKYQDRVIVEGFDTLLVDFVKKYNTNVIIRGVRLFTDFEYELQIAMTNYNLAKVETFFMMPSQELIHISSSIVKDVAFHKGDVTSLVPKYVEKKLKEKFKC